MKTVVIIAAAALALPASAQANNTHARSAMRTAERHFHKSTGHRAEHSRARCWSYTDWKTWRCKARVRGHGVVGNYDIKIIKANGKVRITAFNYVT